MPMNPKGMIRFLKKNGFEVVSVNGSHYYMVNPKTGKATTVPHHTKELKPVMQDKILRQAGLK